MIVVNHGDKFFLSKKISCNWNGNRRTKRIREEKKELQIFQLMKKRNKFTKNM